ncbi:hypothetical protein D3C85_1851650 [compost metagenome]
MTSEIRNPPNFLLITYMKGDYIKDYQVYNCKLDYPISKDTYVKRRNRAILKLLLVFHDSGHVNIDELLKSKKGGVRFKG